MHTLSELADYQDDSGNRIECHPEARAARVRISFRGSRNVVRIGPRPLLDTLSLVFDCDDGVFEIGTGGSRLSVSARLGQDSSILIGDGTTSTDVVVFSATEGTTIRVGADVMFASENQVRADDGHPIFDVRTGRRVNVSRDITIGPHVWLGWGALVLGGSEIGEGSVLGAGAILKGRIPNNAVAAGVPARVVRKDIAWERPHLSLVPPFYKPDASTIAKSRYWKLTVDPVAERSLRRRARRLVGRARRRLRRVLAPRQR